MNLKELKSNDMSKQEKMDHIWEYYKLHIIGTVIGLIIIYSFLNIWVFNPPPKNALDITIRTEWYENEQGALLKEELNPLIIDEGVNEEVMIEHLPVGEAIDPQMMMASEAKFVGKIEVDEMDIMIMSEYVYLGMLQQDALADLYEIESEYGVDFPDDLMVIGTAVSTGEGAYALNVNHIPKFHRLVGESDQPFYASIFVNSEKIDRALEALDYVIE